MIADVADLLACPVCGRALELSGALTCELGHSFDISRKGYVDLVAPVGRKAPEGDTAAMVADRAEFLAGGHYAPLAEALRGALGGGILADLGCGPGYYLRELLPQFHRAIACDVSVAAVAEVARGGGPVGAVRANVKTTIAIRDAAADAITVIFAPRNPPEWHRILRPGGALAVVIPTEAHLQELRHLGLVLDIEHDKRDRLLREVDGLFVPTGSTRVDWTIPAEPATLGHLIGMGPSAYHRDALGELADDELPAEVTASVEVLLFAPS